MKQLTKLFFSLFFAMSFLTITIAPAVMMLVDNDSEIIQIYNTAEEEENKDENKFENDIVFNSQPNSNKRNINTSNIRGTGYNFLSYSKPHLNLIFPPPEFC